jgi:hypothetical protein
MVKKHPQLYLINHTMQEEMDFISQSLLQDLDIKFETPIAHLIPRTPTESIVGNSSILSYGGYSVTLGFWWHLTFPEYVVEQTLLFMENNSDSTTADVAEWLDRCLK